MASLLELIRVRSRLQGGDLREVRLADRSTPVSRRPPRPTPRRAGPRFAGTRPYDATAIPGMPFSSPNSADETVTEKPSIDSGVFRLP